MSKVVDQYVQVLLERDCKENKVQMVCFIPLKLSKKKICIDDNKVIWNIKEVYMPSVRSESEAKIRSADYRNQRKASDI